MNSFGIPRMSTRQYQQQLIETIWHGAVGQIRGGSAEIVLTAQEGRQLGQSGVNAVAQRFSMLIRNRASVLYDPSIDAIRILPPPRIGMVVSDQHLGIKGRLNSTPETSPESELASSEVESTASPPSKQLSCRAASANRSKIAKERIAKVPRPPNAFILYRQHHHPIIKQNNPGVHNNQISVLLGLQWKNETEAVKAAFREKAEEVKRKHNENHPEYQYQPRKPSERRKRAGRTKPANVANSAPSNTLAQQPAAATPLASSPTLDTAPVDESSDPKSSLPFFRFTADAEHMIHDFSFHDPALFNDIVKDYNTTPGLLPAAHQGYISPQALLIGPSVASSREYAADAARLNYPELDRRAQELRDRLALGGSSMNLLRTQSASDLDAAVSSTQLSTNDINSSEDAYNKAWKVTAQNEDDRMDQLELDFGQGRIPDYTGILYSDGDYAIDPVFGSDGVDADADIFAHGIV